MDFSRIQSAIDIPKMQAKHVTGVGVGGSLQFYANLVRCGVRDFTLIDMDIVDSTNVARQDHVPAHVGVPKVNAAAKILQSIDQNVHVLPVAADFTTLDDERVKNTLGHTDLLVYATDSFKAQARGNEVCLVLNKPGVWPGLYRGGLAGEVVFWHPDLPACFRCLCAKRYRAREAAPGASLDPPSTGATIFDIHFLDSIAGMIAVGLLTRGSPNRFGTLIDRLGSRNFIQIKIDSEYTWSGRDVVREKLGIAPDHSGDALFAWNTVALRDPAGGGDCPDCKRFRYNDEESATI